jgi:hypothetical protein
VPESLDFVPVASTLIAVTDVIVGTITSPDGSQRAFNNDDELFDATVAERRFPTTQVIHVPSAC